MDEFNLSRLLFGNETPEPSAVNVSSASVVEMVAVTSSNHGVVIVKSAEDDMNEIFESGEPGVDFIELDDDGSFDEAEVDDEGPIDDSAIDETDGDGVDIEGDDYSAYSVSAYHAAAVALAEEEEENEDDPVPDEGLSATDEIDDGDATEPEEPGDPSLDDPIPDENLVSAEVDDSEYTLTDDSGIDDDTGEEVEISDGTAEVETTVSVRAGDRVMVSIQNGKMTVVGVIGGGDIAEAETALAQAAADEAASDAAAAQEAADSAQEKADQADAAANAAQESANAAQAAADQAATEAAEAYQKASDAQAKADLVETNMAGINAEVSNIKQDAAAIRTEMASSIESVKTEASATYATKTDLSTTESTLRKETSDSIAAVQTTMSQDYAKKTDVDGAIVDAKEELQTQITQNANEISSVAKSVETVKIDVTANATKAQEAKEDASAAQATADAAKTDAAQAATAAATAQAAADTAKANADTAQAAADAAAADLATAQAKLAEVESNANATAADLATAKQAVQDAQAAADAAAEDAATAQAAANIAQSTADAAKASAANAKTAADNAQAAADEAKADISALQSRVTACETSITQNSEQIALRATKTEVTQAINDIEVGGRNLLLETNRGTLHWGISQWNGAMQCSEKTFDDLGGITGVRVDLSSVSTNWAYAFFSCNSLRELFASSYGEQFTLSFDFRTDLDGKMNVEFVNGNYLNKMITFGTVSVVADDWNHISLTGNVIGTTISDQILYFNIFSLQSSGATYFEFANLKIEKGNKATDWTPAPEDVEADATSKADAALAGAKSYADAQILVSANEIKQTVSETYQTIAAMGNYSTTEQMNSAINQSASNITSSVSETYATKTELDETSDRVTSSESVIEQLSDSIASMVRSGDETSLVKQDANGLFYFDIGAIQDSTNETANKLSGLLDTIGDVDYESGETILGRLSEMETALNAVGLKTEYVTVSTYEDEPCIILGESDSAFKLLITNTRIVFLEGSTETTYIRDNTLVTNNVEVKNELRQGSWKWITRANGNLGLVWTGGAE